MANSRILLRFAVAFVVSSRMFDSPCSLSRDTRTESIASPRSLALAKSSVRLDQSRRLARRLAEEIDHMTCACDAGPAALTYDGAFVVLAFQHVLGRTPSDAERVECEAYLRAETKQIATQTDSTPFNSTPTAALTPAEQAAQCARENLVDVLFSQTDVVQAR